MVYLYIFIAIIAGQSEATAEKLEKFGRHFGIIFQIVDDWADFSRSKMKDHKDRGVDIANGFLTLPWIILLEKCTQAEKAKVLEIIDAKKPAGLSQPVIQELYEKYNLEELMRQKIFEHYEEAENALDSVKGFDSSELKIFLDFVIAEFNKVNKSK